MAPGAITEWEAAYTQAGSLALDIQVNPAQLRLGMSPGDVQNALSQETAVDFITYVNELQVTA